MIFLIVYFLFAFVLWFPVYSSLEGVVSDNDARIHLTYILAGAWPVTAFVVCIAIFTEMCKS